MAIYNVISEEQDQTDIGFLVRRVNISFMLCTIFYARFSHLHHGIGLESKPAYSILIDTQL